MSSSKTNIEKAADLLDFFRTELKSAFAQIGFDAHEHTEAYLAHLLRGFGRLRPDHVEVGFAKPAALLLCEAMNSAGEQRMEAYRRLGDASLFNCGFFSAHLTRRTLNEDYYRRIGQIAYQNLGDLMAFKKTGGVFGQIYFELAEKFDAFVEALRCLGRTSSSHRTPYSTLIDRLRRGEAVTTAELRQAGLIAPDAAN